MIFKGPDFSSFGFSSAETETGFRKHHHNPKETRVIILFGLIVFSLFLFLDYFLFPEYFLRILLIRAGIILPVLSFLFFMTYSRFYDRISIIIFIGVAAIAAAGIIIIEYIVRDSPYAEMYFYGIAQVLIVFYGTGKVSLLPAILCGMLIIIPAVIVDTVFIESDIHRIVTKTLFMLTMFFLGNIVSFVIQSSARDRYLSHQRAEELSITDSLTGLRNRLFYEQIIKDEMMNFTNINNSNRAGLTERSSDNNETGNYAYILIDIDFFKRINDSYGHDAGDQVLKEVSARLSKTIRSYDVLVRWGGEEFLLLLRQTRMEHIELLVNRIKSEISESPFIIDGKSECITVSGGIIVINSNSPAGMLTADSLFALADKALYYSKENGRNRFTQIRSEGNGLDRKDTFSEISVPIRG